MLIDKAEDLGKLKFIGEIIDAEGANAVGTLCTEIQKTLPDAVILLGSSSGDKANIWLSVPQQFSKELNAGNLIREIAKEIEGGGGGQPVFASSIGKKPEGLQAAIEKGRGLVAKVL